MSSNDLEYEWRVFATEAVAQILSYMQLNGWYKVQTQTSASRRVYILSNKGDTEVAIVTSEYNYATLEYGLTMKSTEDFIVSGCSHLLEEADERAKTLVKKLKEYRTYRALEGTV